MCGCSDACAHDPLLLSIATKSKVTRGAEIQFGMRYTDALSLDAEGRYSVDLTRIGVIKPDAGLSHRTRGQLNEAGRSWRRMMKHLRS
jgi:hypothetical protein